MKTIITTTALILVLATAALAGPTLPAQAQRIWAPEGDLISYDQNHATATLIINDDHGDWAKAAEDWAIRGKTFGYGLFNYQHTSDSNHQLNVRGDGGNVPGSGLAGNVGLWSSTPGKYRVRLLYSKHDHYYDRDSELRNPGFPYPPEPPALSDSPHLDWRRGRLDLSWHLSSAFDVTFGIADLRREGSKGSLLRGTSGEAPPAVLSQKTKQYEVYLGGVFRAGNLGGGLTLAMRNADGWRTRSGTNGHDYDEERKSYRAALDLAYDVSGGTRLAAYGALNRLELNGREIWGGGDGSTNSDSENAVGLLALQTRLGRKTNLLASARFEGLKNESQIDDMAGVLYAGDTDRQRQDYRLVLGNTSLPRTRLRLQYRYTNADREGVTSQDGRPGEPTVTVAQGLNENRVRHDVDFRANANLSKAVKFKLGVRYNKQDVEQTASGDDWYGILGDHNRSRLGWTAALKTRPHPNVPVDLGYQGIDQTFERTAGELAETTWKANRLFLNINWIASARLSMYGMVNYGKETYELTGVGDPAAGQAAYEYDGQTWRFIPGAVFHVTNTLELEGMWEGIRYENTGSETAALDAVKADHDRALVRARWQTTPKFAVTASYRRNEFFENRWDNYIQDLWGLSVSGLF